MWRLSKWGHIGCAAFVRRPEANVSAARRKLKSGGENGFGMGESGRMTSRSARAAKPDSQIQSVFLRESIAITWLNLVKPGDWRRGTNKAAARQTALASPSISRRDVPWVPAEDNIVSM
jgi:hypothetical protein